MCEIACSNWRATLSGERASSSPQISRVGTAMRDSRSRWSAWAIANSCVLRLSERTAAGDLLEQRDELGWRFAGEPRRKRKGGIELLGGRSQRLRRAPDPGAHLLLGQRPFQPAWVPR
jgi:hypothetical protein